MSPARILLSCLPFFLLAGCGPDKNSPVYQRKQAFKQMLRHKEAMYGMLNGRLDYDPQRFAVEMAQLQAVSGKPWPLFTELNSNHARQDILLEPAAFKQAQDRFRQALAGLSAIRPSDRGEELRAPFKAMADSCQACHDRFRIE